MLDYVKYVEHIGSLQKVDKVEDNIECNVLTPQGSWSNILSGLSELFDCRRTENFSVCPLTIFT